MDVRIYLFYSWTTSCNGGPFLLWFFIFGLGFLERFLDIGCLLGFSSSLNAAIVFTHIFNWKSFSRADYQQPHLSQSMVRQPHSFLLLPSQITAVHIYMQTLKEWKQLDLVYMDFRAIRTEDVIMRWWLRRQVKNRTWRTGTVSFLRCVGCLFIHAI